MMKTAIAAGVLTLLAGCATMPSAASMPEGAWVLAQWEDGQYYPGVLSGRSAGKYVVSFDDGTSATLGGRQIRPYDWQIGTAILCEINEGEMSEVTISTMGPQPTDLGVLDENGATRPTETGKCRALA